ncbi:MAG TPA: response regulator transcription factor [Thermomicrobiales bacterium]|jgi:two-component system response regulator MprA
MAAETAPVFILVVDDDARIAASLRRALVYEGYEVAIAADGPAALASARTRPPDLVVLDVMLPGFDGMDVCRRLRREDDVPILMLTALDATADRVAGLDTGADDYLTKPFAYEELLARVRALLRRRDPKPLQTLRYGDLTLEPETRDVRRGDRPIALTTLEFDLLHYFLRHPRLVLSRERLLDAVWGDEVAVTPNAVDVYVGYLRQKLEASGEPRLIQTVRGVGYVLRDCAQV